MLCKTETNTLKTVVEYINEVKSIGRMNGFAKGKQVKQKKKKKTIKKMKKDGEMKEANAIHAFEVISGQLKMRVISYLRLDITNTAIRSLVAGLSKSMSERFMDELRIDIFTDVMNFYKFGDIFMRSLEVHNWLYKSGYIKRSAKLAELLTNDNGFAFGEDILVLNDHYISEATKILESDENEYSKEKNDIQTTQGNYSFMLNIVVLQKAMKLALEDVEKNRLTDKATLRNCKYITTQVESLSSIIKDYVKTTGESVLKHIEDELEYKSMLEYRKTFGEYKDIIQVTCDAEGIRFIKENEYIFYSYYEELLGMNKKRLMEEMEWLGVA